MDRNYNIDKLKTYCIFAIISLHIFLHGGVLSSVEPFSAKYNIVWILEIFYFGAVNIFAIVSGYLTFGKKTKISSVKKIISDYFSIVIISGLIVFMITKVSNQTFDYNKIFSINWYFISYLGMLLFKPIIDTWLINSTNSDIIKQSRIIFLVVFILSIVSSRDYLFLGSGYSPLWLTLMYLLGALLKKQIFEINISKRRIQYLIIICTIMIFLSKNGVEYLLYILTGNQIGFSRFFSNTSILVVAHSLLIVLLAIKTESIKSSKSDIYTVISNFTFQLYIWHDNAFIRDYIIANNFSFIVNYNIILFIILLIFIPSVVLFITIISEIIRNKLFAFE